MSSLWPVQASELAGRVDTLFLTLLAVSGLIALLLAVLVVVFSVRFRRGREARRERLPRRRRRRLEMVWTLVPLGVFLALFTWAAVLYVDGRRNDPEALQIHVVGKQWMWKFQHPTGQREINELHLPAGRTVSLLMTSQDVIHSLYLPAFRQKHDVLPQRYSRLTVTPNRPGRYPLFCAEFCGTGHSRMRGTVHVLEFAAYQQWLADSAAPTTPARRGATLYRHHGCGACHDAASGVQAPPLEGLAGTRVTLANGRTVTADADYLRAAIVTPDAHVRAGYPPIMPSYAGRLDAHAVLDLVSHLQSLDGAQPPTGEVAAARTAGGDG